MLAPSAGCRLHLFPLLPSYSIVLDRSALQLTVSVPARVIGIKASTGISRLVVEVQCMAASCVEKVKDVDRFEGGFFKELAASAAGDGEKLEDGGG